MTKTNSRKITVELVDAPKQLDLRFIAVAIAEKFKMEEGKRNDRRKQI